MKTYNEGRISAKIGSLSLGLRQLESTLIGDKEDREKVIRSQVILKYLKQDVKRMKEILGE